jgi:hypothetical protein
MQPSRVLYTLILSLSLLFILAPIGAGPNAVDKPADLGDGSPGAKVIINGITVPKDKITSLEHTYGVPIQPGRYWYDKISGLWGSEGSPIMGQIVSDLDVGGPLKAKASNGDTGVFINGRELPMQEVMFLEQLGPVSPGRYWLNARGIAGFEGGPPQFDLGAAIAAQNKKKEGGTARPPEDTSAVTTTAPTSSIPRAAPVS